MVEVTRVLTHHLTEPVHLEVRLPTPVQRVHGLYTQQQHSPVPRVVTGSRVGGMIHWKTAQMRKFVNAR